MNAVFIRGLAALIPVCMLFSGSVMMFSRKRDVYSALQLLGAGSLVLVVLTHICEELHLFPRMNWGSQNSVGHYLDMSTAILGIALFPLGYLLHALKKNCG